MSQATSKTHAASTLTRREKGDLCDYVKKLGCVVAWVEGESAAKLWGWEHPAYRCDDLWEDAEDCAEAFMRMLMEKLAYEFSMDLVPRDKVFDIKFVLNRAAHCPSFIDQKQAAQALAVVDKILAV